MKIYTTEGIRHICTKVLERDDITMLDLMERAAESITYELMARWRISQRFVIFAGPGDNGGDALAVARHLQQQGYRPEVYLFNIRSSQMSPCCAANRDRLLELEGGLEFEEVTGTFAPPELGPTDVVIDGLFGTGLTSPLKGGYTSLVQYINNSEAYIVSIDMPSGLFGEWNVGTDSRNIIRANLTLTYQFNRLAFFFAENAQYLGEIKVLDMDLNLEGVGNTPTDFYLIERDDVRHMLKVPDKFCNKYDNGAVLLVAGSYGMMGAAVLAARGAMRSGAGIVTVHSPMCGYDILQTSVPEAIVEPDIDRLITKSIPMNHQYSVVALGPGMGTSPETVDAIDQFIKTFRRPCLLDADALNCIAKRQQLIRLIPNGSVLTPHASEFDRLFGVHNTEEERLKKAIVMSKLNEITIVLKGHYTMTVRPDGKVYINSTGNAGMATAGSGDVLTGVIASLIAQGNAPDWSVVMGVYLHGLAGDLAAQEHGQWGLVASDIADNMGRAINTVMSGK